MTMKVGFIGLGAMGLPLAKNLQRKGFAVNGYDIDPHRAVAIVELGGSKAASVAEAAALAASGAGAKITVARITAPDGMATCAMAETKEAKT